jgi:hypothetical protein
MHLDREELLKFGAPDWKKADRVSELLTFVLVVHHQSQI